MVLCSRFNGIALPFLNMKLRLSPTFAMYIVLFFINTTLHVVPMSFAIRSSMFTLNKLCEEEEFLIVLISDFLL